MQAQLIYPDQDVAALIAARLAKSNGVAYDVKKVVTGFQVSPKAVPPAADTLMNSIAALVIKEDVDKVDQHKAMTFASIDKEIKTPSTGEGVTLTPKTPKPAVQTAAAKKPLAGPFFTGKYKLMNDAPFYLSVYVDGKPKHFGKPNLLSWTVFVPEGHSFKWVEATMSASYAKKKGLV